MNEYQKMQITLRLTSFILQIKKTNTNTYCHDDLVKYSVTEKDANGDRALTPHSDTQHRREERGQPGCGPGQGQAAHHAILGACGCSPGKAACP